jgi:hypothetical protein
MQPTEYIQDIAQEYGLAVHPSDRGIELRFPDGASIISLTAVDDHIVWGVHPLGMGKMENRNAFGMGTSLDEALNDAEGVLRHYLKNTPRNEVEAVWPVEVLSRVNLWHATTSSGLWPRRVK